MDKEWKNEKEFKDAARKIVFELVKTDPEFKRKCQEMAAMNLPTSKKDMILKYGFTEEEGDLLLTSGCMRVNEEVNND